MCGIALGWNNKTIVITTPITFVATVNAALYCGQKLILQILIQRP